MGVGELWTAVSPGEWVETDGDCGVGVVEPMLIGSTCDEKGWYDLGGPELALSFARRRFRRRNMREKEKEMRLRNMMERFIMVGGRHLMERVTVENTKGERGGNTVTNPYFLRGVPARQLYHINLIDVETSA